LDIGCGPGKDAKHFTEQGYDVTGLDLSEGLLKIAKEYCPEATFVQGDIRKLPFPDKSFDGVFACASILHMEKSQLPIVLKETKRVLKKMVLCS
jgi:ubiquinone/menaquinone biosynthesis C-methylase UbiE